jgi:hypothetical protein
MGCSALLCFSSLAIQERASGGRLGIVVAGVSPAKSFCFAADTAASTGRVVPLRWQGRVACDSLRFAAGSQRDESVRLVDTAAATTDVVIKGRPDRLDRLYRPEAEIET